MMSYSYISNSAKIMEEYVQDNHSTSEKSKKVREHIQNIAEAFNIKIPTNVKDKEETDDSIDNEEDDSTANKESLYWESRREEEPLNEYSEFDELLTGVFPQVFPLGRAYPKKKRFDNNEI